MLPISSSWSSNLSASCWLIAASKLRARLFDLLNTIPALSAHVKMILISQNYINFNGSSLHQYKSLLHLDISFNHITTLISGMFVQQHQLQILNLEYNKIQILFNGVFLGLNSLTHLLLKGNPLHSVGSRSFIGLENLQEIDLSNMSIEQIEPYAFSGLSHLKHINLQQNPLKHLKAFTFYDIPSVEILNLSGNIFTEIDNFAFTPKVSLKMIIFLRSDMCCYAPKMTKCSPPKELGVSSCQELLRGHAMKTLLWVTSCFSLLGNILVIILKIYTPLRHCHSLLLIVQAMANILRVIYLVIIAVVDTYFGNTFALIAIEWTTTFTCRVAGFLSAMAFEISITKFLAITIEQSILVTYPLSAHIVQVQKAKGLLLLIFILLSVSCLAICWLYPVTTYLCLYLFPGNRNSTIKYSHAALIISVVNTTLYLLSCHLSGYVLYRMNSTRIKAGRKFSKQEREYNTRVILVCLLYSFSVLFVLLVNILAMVGIKVDHVILAYASVTIVPLTSLTDPLMYTLTTRNFRKLVFK